MALSLRLPSPDVIRHSALWSPDFPRLPFKTAAIIFHTHRKYNIKKAAVKKTTAKKFNAFGTEGPSPKGTLFVVEVALEHFVVGPAVMTVWVCELVQNRINFISIMDNEGFFGSTSYRRAFVLFAMMA